MSTEHREFFQLYFTVLMSWFYFFGGLTLVNMAINENSGLLTLTSFVIFGYFISERMSTWLEQG